MRFRKQIISLILAFVLFICFGGGNVLADALKIIVNVSQEDNSSDSLYGNSLRKIETWIYGNSKDELGNAKISMSIYDDKQRFTEFKKVKEPEITDSYLSGYAYLRRDNSEIQLPVSPNYKLDVNVEANENKAVKSVDFDVRPIHTIPNNIKVTDVKNLGDGKIKVTWSKLEDITYYKVYYGSMIGLNPQDKSYLYVDKEATDINFKYDKSYSENSEYYIFIMAYRDQRRIGRSDEYVVRLSKGDASKWYGTREERAQPSSNNVTGINYNWLSPYAHNSIAHTVIDNKQPADANLRSIIINGNTPIKNFSSFTYSYKHEIPYAYKNIPNVSAIPNDNNAKVMITQAKGVPGTATITVTGRDGVTKRTYQISFTRSEAMSAALASLYLSKGNLIPQFSPNILIYNVELPPFTKDIPVITAVQEDQKAQITVNQANELPGEAKITVVSQDGAITKDYVVRITNKSLLSYGSVDTYVYIVAISAFFVGIIVALFLRRGKKSKKQVMTPENSSAKVEVEDEAEAKAEVK